MLFSSLLFLFVFLPITLCLYYLVPKKYRNFRNLVLFLTSLLFYAWGEPTYIVLMLISIAVNYFLAIFINKFKYKKLLLYFTIIFNVGILGFYKYADFLINNINNILNLDFNLLDLALPIGISFYTFQIMSYVIDVYRKKVAVQKNILTLATYISLFPQLIAGPIVRYSTIEEQLSNRKESIGLFSQGIRRFIIGLGKKVIIANNVAQVANMVFDNDPSEIGTIILLIGTIAYSLQIYFDFSGYSDMAIGLGRMFGFEFLENFNYPYISKSITDFWRRWHISLSTWFRDYIYIPLGGNRVSKLKFYRNIFAVWFLTGLWHGASWNYVIWGLYFAIILLIEKNLLKNFFKDKFKFLNHLYAIFLILIGWIIFRVENLNDLLLFLRKIIFFEKSNMYDFIINNHKILFVLPYFLFGIIGSTPIIKKLYEYLNTHKNIIWKIVYDILIFIIFIISIIFLVSSNFNPFIYFRF